MFDGELQCSASTNAVAEGGCIVAYPSGRRRSSRGEAPIRANACRPSGRKGSSVCHNRDDQNGSRRSNLDWHPRDQHRRDESANHVAHRNSSDERLVEGMRQYDPSISRNCDQPNRPNSCSTIFGNYSSDITGDGPGAPFPRHYTIEVETLNYSEGTGFIKCTESTKVLRYMSRSEIRKNARRQRLANGLCNRLVMCDKNVTSIILSYLSGLSASVHIRGGIISDDTRGVDYLAGLTYRLLDQGHDSDRGTVYSDESARREYYEEVYLPHLQDLAREWNDF